MSKLAPISGPQSSPQRKVSLNSFLWALDDHNFAHSFWKRSGRAEKSFHEDTNDDVSITREDLFFS